MGSSISACSRNRKGRNVIDPSKANWDQLLPDLLTMIVRKLDLYEDIVALGGVCKLWRSVVIKPNMINHPSRSVQPPWLMLPEKSSEADSGGFVSLSKGGMVHKLEFPEARGKWCMESMGWLITMDEGGGMELLHPLTRARIPLPHLRTYRFFKKEREEHGIKPLKGYVRRATLSASPSATADYALMLIMGLRSDLVFWKPGNSVWNHVRGGGEERAYLNVIYHKKKFYAIDARDDISVCDLRGGPNSNPNSTILQKSVGRVRRSPEDEFIPVRGVYFVECGGALPLVEKIVCFYDDEYQTLSFRVRKAAADSTRMSDWERVEGLGGASIFVGHNTAICVHSPAAGGVKANCIYFTDDFFFGYAGTNRLIIGGKDMGIYNMVSRRIEPLYQGRASLDKYCPPIWVSPSF